MEQVEMKALERTARVTEKLADFVGDVVLQFLQKQDYREETGIRALLQHVRKGHGTLAAAVTQMQAKEMEWRLQKAHIPYVEIGHEEEGGERRTMFFVYRDSDRDGMQKLLKEMELQLDSSCREVDPETFGILTDGQSYGRAGGFSDVEILAFQESAKNYNLKYCVVADGKQYGIVADDKEMLEEAMIDMAYELSGERGMEYERRLSSCLQEWERFCGEAAPEPGCVKYVVDAANPGNFLSIDGEGITSHTVGRRSGPDGKGLYDMNRTYGYDGRQLARLFQELNKPVLVKDSGFPLVKGLTDQKQAVLAGDFQKQWEAFRRQHMGEGPAVAPKPEPLPEAGQKGQAALTRKLIKATRSVDVGELPKEWQEVRMRADAKGIRTETMGQEQKKHLREYDIDRRIAADVGR